MPNYSLVLDTKFKPFSYQEMLAPVMAATQAHQALETEYGDLATKASVWERMANEQTDPYAYKMYKTYSEDLESMAEQLARNGLNPASRRNMLNMKSRYSSEILPIETAYKRREELAAEQRKAIAADPTLRYQRAASQMSLDDFIRNPSLDYGKSYSGALLTKQVSQAAAHYAKVLTEEGGLERLGLPYQYKSKIRHGASPEEILAVINDAALKGHQGAVDFLRSIRDQVLQSSGIAEWADPITKEEFKAFANQGLYSALGQTDIKNYTDSYSMQEAHAINKENRKNAENEPDNNIYYRHSFKSTVDKSKDTSNLANDRDLLKEVIKNPSLLEKTSKRVRTEPLNPDAILFSETGSAKEETYYPYKEALERLSKKYGDINIKVNDGRVSSNLDGIIDRINADIESSAIRESSYLLNITQSDLITQVLRENMGSYYRRSNNTGLSKIENGKISGEVDVDDIGDYFTSNSFIEYDPSLGIVITSADKDGVNSAVLDFELLDDSERNLYKEHVNINTLLDYGEIGEATDRINKVMKVLYKKFNTLQKRQSNTFSK